MASKICQKLLKPCRNSRLFPCSTVLAKNVTYRNYNVTRTSTYFQLSNPLVLRKRSFTSLNFEIGCAFGAHIERSIPDGRLGLTLRYSAQRYCTKTGGEELREKVEKILSKSPTATEEKLQEQLTILDLLCQHREGAVSSADVTEAAKHINGDTLYELALVVYTIREQIGEDTIDFWAPLFRLASLAGNEDAKYTYAQMLRSGTGIDPDLLEAAKLFRDLANDGHPYAQFALAGMYYHGIGLDQDFETAFQLYEKSAKNGVDMAHSMLGNMYLNGQAVEQNDKLALQYFQTGAKKGDPTAELSLAHCYSYGKGVTQDLTKAFEYHVSAAEKGHPIGMYNVGTQYFAGKGVDVNMEKAAEYFEKAANLGFELAQINLGNMYYNGLGVEKNWERAKELYRQAAPTNKNAAALLKEVEEDERKLREEQKPEE